MRLLRNALDNGKIGRRLWQYISADKEHAVDHVWSLLNYDTKASLLTEAQCRLRSTANHDAWTEALAGLLLSIAKKTCARLISEERRQLLIQVADTLRGTYWEGNPVEEGQELFEALICYWDGKPLRVWRAVD